MKNNEYYELLTALYEGVYIVDHERKIIFWNKGAEQITGYTKEEVENSFCFNNILNHIDEQGNQLCLKGCPLHHTLKTGEILENKVYLHHKEGHRVPVNVRTLPLYDRDGNIISAIEVFQDLRLKVDIIQENEQLKEIVTKDELTNIFNRRYLDFTLDKKIEQAKKFSQPFSMLFFDIDRFKLVNDNYGHQVGDDILKLVSTTINSNLRANDILGRYGGEEFIVILDITSEELLRRIGEKLRMLIEKSTYENGDIKLNVTISIGGAVYKPDMTKEELINKADELMYQAKNTGRNKVVV